MTGGVESPRAAERILVIKLGALGDFVLATGPFAAIRSHHPAAFIALLTTAPYAELGERSGFFDEVLVDGRPGWRDVARWFDLRRTLRAGRFERVYDLQSNDRTGMYRYLLWPSGAAWLSDSGSNGPRHAFDRHAAMLSRAGIDTVPGPDLSRIDADITRFALPPDYALLVPGAAPHRPAKRWPAERYGELAAMLASRSITPVIVGANGDADAAQTLLKRCATAVDLVGRTSLFDIPALGRGAVAAVGNDTGPMHLIAPTGCPSVVLFSVASDPAQSAPRGANVRVMQRQSLDQLPADEVLAVLEETVRSSTKATTNASALSANNAP